MNRMLRIICFTAAAFMIMAAFCGCGDDKESPDSSSGPTVSPTAPPVIDIDLSTLLTSGQITEAVGITMGEAQLQEDGTIVRYCAVSSEGESDEIYTEILMEEASRENFDNMISEISDLEPTPNLCEAALWSATEGDLYAYRSGYMFQVSIRYPGKSSSTLLTACRQIAALIDEKLIS